MESEKKGRANYKEKNWNSWNGPDSKRTSKIAHALVDFFISRILDDVPILVSIIFVRYSLELWHLLFCRISHCYSVIGIVCATATQGCQFCATKLGLKMQKPEPILTPSWKSSLVVEFPTFRNRSKWAINSKGLARLHIRHMWNTAHNVNGVAKFIWQNSWSAVLKKA